MTVMLVTTFLMTLVMLIVWQRSILIALCFFFVFGSIELLYISSALFKVPQGGWVPLVLAGIFMFIMYVWHYGTTKKYEFDVQNKVSMKWLLTLGPSLGIVRVPGIGLIYTELVTGVPAIFSHFVTNLPAFHEVLVFVCMKSVPVPYVPHNERYLVGRVGPKDYRMYRCVVRYGYKDVHADDSNFENRLILNLAEFIQTEGAAPWIPSSSEISLDGRMTVMGTASNRFLTTSSLPFSLNHIEERTASLPTSNGDSMQSLERIRSPSFGRKKRVHFELPKSENGDMDPEIRKELADLIEAKEAGVAYVMGHSYVKAKKSSSFLKKLAINVVYTFLRRNCRDPAMTLSIPHISLIEVGMIYYV
jgi:KUP system potassium uptake protein